MQLNEQEQARLDEIDYACEALYRRAIRRHMDKAGNVETLSWQSIKEDMYLSPRRGVLQKNLSKDQLRRMVKQLEKVGLVIIKTNDCKLILECPLASKAAREPTTKATRVQTAQTSAMTGFTECDIENAAREATREVEHIEKPTTKAARVCDASEQAQSSAQLDLFGDKIIKPATKATSLAAKKQMDNIDINIINNNINNNTLLSKFDDFWHSYPRKQKKKLAQKLWVKKSLDRVAEKIIDDIVWRTTNDPQWQNPQYIPLPTTYFNDERWEDERQEVNYASTINSRLRPRADRNTEVFENCLSDYQASRAH